MENTFEVINDYPINDIRRIKILSDKTYLDKKEDVFEFIINNMMVGVLVFKVNADKKIEAVYTNENYFGIMGYEIEKYLKKIKDITSTFVRDDELKFLDSVRECKNEKDKFQFIFRSQKSNNQIGWYNINVINIGNIDGVCPLFFSFIEEVTSIMSEYVALKEMVNLKEQLNIERERYRILAETTPAILFEYFPDKDSMIFNYNFPENHERKIIHNYLQFLDNTPLVHIRHIKMFKNALLEACQIPVKKTIEYLSEVSGGGYRWHRTIYTSFSDDKGKIVSVLGRIYDVNEEVVEREKQANSLKIDSLTGAYLREAGRTMMESEMSKNEITPAYMIMLDIDNFKNLNETRGHSYGDLFLKRFTQKAIELNEDKGFVIRYGGDEFLLFVRYENKDKLDEMVDDLHDFCNKMSKDIDAMVDFSEGIVLCYGKTLSQAFEEADREMFKMKKQKGKQKSV